MGPAERLGRVGIGGEADLLLRAVLGDASAKVTSDQQFGGRKGARLINREEQDSALSWWASRKYRASLSSVPQPQGGCTQGTPGAMGNP